MQLKNKFISNYETGQKSCLCQKALTPYLGTKTRENRMKI